jgi:hypothetical protein
MAYKRTTIGPLNKVVRWNDATQHFMGVHDDAGAAIAGLTGYIPQVAASGYIDLVSLATAGIVAGPATSTDHGLARWNGTGGDVLHDGVTTMDDTGNITLPASATVGCVGDTDTLTFKVDELELTSRLNSTRQICMTASDAVTWMTDYLAGVAHGVLLFDAANAMTLGANTLLIGAATIAAGPVFTLHPVYIFGSAVTAGSRINALRGILSVEDDAAGNAGTLRLYSTAGNPFYLFANNAGTGLRIHNAAPTADTDGALLTPDWPSPGAIGSTAANTGNFTRLSADTYTHSTINVFTDADTTPDVSISTVWKAYGTACAITDFDGVATCRELVVVGSYMNEVQTITVTNGNDADSFTVTFGADTTGALGWDISAVDMLAALEGLASIGAGNVTVTLVPAADGGVYTVTFCGALAETDVAQMTSTPTDCTVAHATTVIGGSANTSSIVYNPAIIDTGGVDIPLNGDSIYRFLFTGIWRRVPSTRSIAGRARITLPEFKVWDAINLNLGATGGAPSDDDLGLVTGAFLTDTPAISSGDCATLTKSRKARFQIQLPQDYIAGTEVQVALVQSLTHAADTSATLDVEACKTAAPATDLCTTAAININTAGTDNWRYFTLDGTGLIPGNTIDCVVTLALSDGAGGFVITATITLAALHYIARGY